ncbi:MAG: hypothetical protein L7U87_02740 [Chlamydiales bacterium]|nr:hypothetical protein [Chlamydiales bacterium]
MSWTNPAAYKNPFLGYTLGCTLNISSRVIGSLHGAVSACRRGENPKERVAELRGTTTDSTDDTDSRTSKAAKTLFQSTSEEVEQMAYDNPRAFVAVKVAGGGAVAYVVLNNLSLAGAIFNQAMSYLMPVIIQQSTAQAVKVYMLSIKNSSATPQLTENEHFAAESVGSITSGLTSYVTDGSGAYYVLIGAISSVGSLATLKNIEGAEEFYSKSKVIELKKGAHRTSRNAIISLKDSFKKTPEPATLVSGAGALYGAAHTLRALPELGAFAVKVVISAGTGVVTCHLANLPRTLANTACPSFSLTALAGTPLGIGGLSDLPMEETIIVSGTALSALMCFQGVKAIRDKLLRGAETNYTEGRKWMLARERVPELLRTTAKNARGLVLTDDAVAYADRGARE